jgi:hypothetical protein
LMLERLVGSLVLLVAFFFFVGYLSLNMHLFRYFGYAGSLFPLFTYDELVWSGATIVYSELLQQTPTILLVFGAIRKVPPRVRRWLATITAVLVTFFLLVHWTSEAIVSGVRARHDRSRQKLHRSVSNGQNGTSPGTRPGRQWCV